MKIKSKVEFFRLWQAGCLGNKLRTWDDPAAAVASGVPLVGFRELGKAGGGAFQMAERDQIRLVAAEWELKGRRYVVCEAAPDHRATLQGEVCRTFNGMEGAMGLSGGLRMRDAIAAGLLKPRSYLETIVLLNRYMDPSSRDDLDALLDLYPDAAVEFTCYEVNVGDLPGRNTIFWETRDY